MALQRPGKIETSGETTLGHPHRRNAREKPEMTRESEGSRMSSSGSIHKPDVRKEPQFLESFEKGRNFSKGEVPRDIGNPYGNRSKDLIHPLQFRIGKEHEPRKGKGLSPERGKIGDVRSSHKGTVFREPRTPGKEFSKIFLDFSKIVITLRHATSLPYSPLERFYKDAKLHLPTPMSPWGTYKLRLCSSFNATYQGKTL